MSSELPQIFSLDEIDRVMAERGNAPRPENDRLDNAGIRPPPKPTDGLPESSIEQQFPHIAQKLTVVWPSEACALYINDLVVNRRDTRQGFPQEIIDDLLMLHAINDMLVSVGKRGQRIAAPASAPVLPPRNAR